MELKNFIMNKIQVVLIERDVNNYLNTTKSEKLNIEDIKKSLIELYASYKNEYDFNYKVIKYEIIEEFYKRLSNHYCATLEHKKYDWLINIIEKYEIELIASSKKLLSELKKEYKKII